MSNTVKINGSNKEYTLSSNIKIYALIDAGFKKTVNGNYTYEHPLYKDCLLYTSPSPRDS